MNANIKKTAEVLDQNKAERVNVLCVKGISPITDYMIFASAETDKQVKGLSDRVNRVLRDDLGVKPAHIEGYSEGDWIIIDYFDFIVHIFTNRQREHYDIENLFGDAEKVEVL